MQARRPRPLPDQRTKNSQPDASPLALSDAVGKESVERTIEKAVRNLPSSRGIKNYKNILGVLDRQYAYKGPDMVQIDPTFNCNSNCIGCWCHSDLLGDLKFGPEKKALTLPFEVLTSLVDELVALGTSAIYVAGGGEPFMHRQLLDFVGYAKKKHGLICHLHTSFTLVGKKAVKRLCEIGVDSITVSVWAGTARAYADTHPNAKENTFHKLKSNLLALNTAKPEGIAKTKVYHVINNLNYHELEAMLEFAIETRSDSVEFTVTDTVGGYTECLLLDEQQLENCRQQSRRIEERAGQDMSIGGCQIVNWQNFTRRLSDPGAVQAQYDSKMIDILPCYVGWTYARVNPDGTVNSCLKSHRFPLGNLYDTSFTEIWNGEAQREFRRHALVSDKSKDPFFKIIGNDLNCEMGCYKTCDNVGHNQRMDSLMRGLAPAELESLEATARLLKSHRGEN